MIIVPSSVYIPRAALFSPSLYVHWSNTCEEMSKIVISMDILGKFVIRYANEVNLPFLCDS